MSLKRQLSSLDRAVTPPATKKKHIEQQAEDQAVKDNASLLASGPSITNNDQDHIKVISWNVNGVRPFLQQTLSSFFQRSLGKPQSRNPASAPSPPVSPSSTPAAPNAPDSHTPPSTSHSPLRDALHRLDWPHLLCLQEVKIAPDDHASQRGLKNAANAGTHANSVGTKPITNFFQTPTANGKATTHDATSQGPRGDQARTSPRHTYEATFSLPRGKHIGLHGRVHGVATLIRSDIFPTITTHKPDWDLEGRILIHTFASSDLVVVNGYWPNGTTHPYRSPLTGAMDGRTRHDIKLRYHEKILQMALDYEKEGKAVIMIGDMNIAPARIDGYPNLRTSPVQHVHNRKDFNDKFLGTEGLNGVDVFRHLHGETRKYTWHSTNAPHGTVCDRVDLIIASRSLVAEDGRAIVDADICDDRASKGHSDHCPLWVTVDLSRARQPHQNTQETSNSPTSKDSLDVAE